MKKTFGLLGIALSISSANAIPPSVSVKEPPTPVQSKDLSTRSFGVRLNLLPMVAATLLKAKAISVEGDIPLGSGFVVGPMASYAFDKQVALNNDSRDINLGMWTLGVRGNYFFSGRKFTDSWYLTSYLNYSRLFADYTLDKTSVEFSAGQSWTTIGALLGYHWFWNSGFNLSTGIGLARYAGGGTSFQVRGQDQNGNTYSTEAESSSVANRSTVLPTLELTMGWVF